MYLQRFAHRPNSATTPHGTGRRRRPTTPRRLPRRSRANTAPDAGVQSTEPESWQRWPRHQTPKGTQVAQSAGCCRQSDRTSACCLSHDVGYDTRTWPGMCAHDRTSEQPSCGFSTSSPSGNGRRSNREPRASPLGRRRLRNCGAAAAAPRGVDHAHKLRKARHKPYGAQGRPGGEKNRSTSIHRKSVRF